MELIEHPPILRVPHIPDQVLYMWIVMAVLVGVSIVATRRLHLVPHGTQNMMEVILEQFVKELDETIGHDGRRYLPLIATLGLFILTSNLLGLVPGLVAPTANMYTTIACAVIVFCYYHYLGIRLGVSGGAIMIAFTVGFLLPLKILVALLQAFVFCLLSMVYIASAVED